ncbi:MAG TPA: phage tail sheath subtilisin-like domain-containing protein [Nitrospira sp.]|nr:phage tail sheath subtilisin-like domain-containing protein [Nitrospira sp.]
MAVLSYPGVYVEEVASGVRPIEAASSSTAAFVGLSEMGPDEEALRITSWTEFQRQYGGYISDGYLAHSVFQFFNNGGRQCYIVRITRSDAVTARVRVQNRATAPVSGLTFSAKNRGAWGNYLYLQIEDGSSDTGNTFKISIRKQKEVDLVPEDFMNIAPLETHDNLNMDPTSANYVVNVLSQASRLINAEVDAANVTLQRGFHRGGNAPTMSAGSNLNFLINLDGDGYQQVALPAALANMAAVAAAIQTAVTALTRLKTSTSPTAFTGFTCAVVNAGMPTEHLLLNSGTTSGTSSVSVQNASSNNAAVSLKLGEGNGGYSENGLARRRPANAESIQIGDAAVAAPVLAVTLGTDGTAPLTELSYSAGFTLLNNKTDFSLLSVPGVGTTTMVDEGMAYCRNRTLQDVFYIGEMDQDDDTPSEAESFRNALTTPNSYGAVYFPWIKALDPTGVSAEPILLPPSGYMAGLYARIDASRGVWKAPAGTEATINGAVGLSINLTDTEQGNLNRISVNCLRRFTTSGIVSWGSRTVSSDPEYKYVPVRRVAIMLRVSIYNGIQWAVFEPNDEGLWSQLRLNITSFMMTLFRQGAFQGATSSQAFFVKCDGETTTQADIDLGIVNVLVGFAPLKPAEFVVVKISQKAGQSST